MALDDRGRPLKRDRFDDVGIERALPQESRTADYFFGLENIDKGGADNLALGLGVEHPGKALKKESGSVNTLEVHSALTSKDSFHALALAGARQPGINKNTFEAGADGAIYESRRHRGIDPAGERHQHSIGGTDLRADLGGFGLDEIRHRPVACFAANLEHEIA